jgi:hypothetical protein
MPKFIATHGVQLGTPPEDVWASFTRDEALDTAEGERRYSFTTDDAAVAAKLRKIKDYGITEEK